MSLLALYPPIEPYASGWLQVGGPHRIYFEQCGQPDGMPALFLHGGPGAGCSAASRRFFDPSRYRVVLFDQRGAGRSTPAAELAQNTTWDLVSDIERLREHLGIERWLVFGGSWGSTLALAYAQSFPQRITALVLRGIFLARRCELNWLYRYGASELFPEAWQSFVEPIPLIERSDLLCAYHRRLTSGDAELCLRAARDWSAWEASVSYLRPQPEQIEASREADFALKLARIETHYFVHGAFLDAEQQLLHGAERLRGIPCTIVQGRYDAVCPPRSAWELAQRWPEAKLELIADAGHSAYEPGITDALIRATDHYARSR